MVNNYTLPRLQCKRCGHEWSPRSDSPPKVCPKCKSPYWDREPKIDLSTADLAYTKGIFDSEGSWDKVNRILRIGNTNLDLLNWLQLRYEGEIKPYPAGELTKKQYWMWTLRGLDAQKFVEALPVPSSLDKTAEVAYIAGLVDGDGTIYMHRRLRQGRPQITPRVVFANTDVSLVQFIYNRYGGWMRVMQPRPGYRERKPYGYLLVAGKGCAGGMIHDLLPHLIIKKGKAKAVLEELNG